jgi:hypothetical protein
VESTPMAGTTVSVRLPIESPTAATQGVPLCLPPPGF